MTNKYCTEVIFVGLEPREQAIIKVHMLSDTAHIITSNFIRKTDDYKYLMKKGYMYTTHSDPKKLTQDEYKAHITKGVDLQKLSCFV